MTHLLPGLRPVIADRPTRPRRRRDQRSQPEVPNLPGRICSAGFAFGLLALAVAAPRAQEPARELRDRVDAYLEPMAAIGMWSGAVLLARGGEVLVARAYGMADREAGIPNTVETRFKLMSTSKTFTGVAVLQLVERGVLELTDPVGDHVPDWPEAWQAVTVHDLLDHTSGIPNREVAWTAVWWRLHAESADPSLAATWRAYAPTASSPLRSPPGTEHRYSNFNTVLAGLVAELASAKRYPALVRERILVPAGLQATGFDDGERHEGLAVGYFRDRHGEPEPSRQNMAGIQPAGGYWSTVDDLYRFDRALRSDSLLGDVARRQLVTPRGEQARGYACCFLNRPVHGRACIQHSGGSNGYVADFLRFVDDDACVVVLSNYALAPILRISHDLAGILFDIDCENAVPVDAAELDACAGIYAREGSGMFTVFQRSGATLQSFEVAPDEDRIGGRLVLPYGSRRFREALGEGVLTFETEDERRLVRRSTPKGEEVLLRVEPDVREWRGTVGTWRVTPAPAGEATIELEDGVLWLRTGQTWPHSAELVPVSGETAMALESASGGVALRRDGDTLRYRDYRGEVIVLQRQ